MERFGKDSIIALATTIGEIPYVRYVNAFYSDGAFYVLTYGLSNKMKQIKEGTSVAFTQGCTRRRVSERHALRALLHLCFIILFLNKII